MIEKGLLETLRLTTAQRDALSMGASDTGIIFNTTTGRYEFWNGSAWIGFAPSGFFLSNRAVDTLYATNQDVDLNNVLINTAGVTMPGAGQYSLPVGDWSLQMSAFFFNHSRRRSAYNYGFYDTGNVKLPLSSLAWGAPTSRVAGAAQVQSVAQGYLSVASGTTTIKTRLTSMVGTATMDGDNSWLKIERVG